MKPFGWPRCARGEAGRHVGRRIHRQLRVVGQQRRRVVRLAVGVEAVPDRERHAEEALPADAPVAVEAADPVLEAGPHVRRMPVQLAAALEQALAERQRADEPLPAGDDLERPIALLVELHRVRDRTRLAEQIARRPQQLDDLRPRLGDRRRDQLIVGGLRRRRVARFPARAAPRDRTQRAVRLHDGAHRQVQLAPPDDVGEIAERADHRDAGALVGAGQRMREDRHGHVEERRPHLAAEQRLVALVVRMRDQRDAGRQQLRAASSRSRSRSPPLTDEAQLVVRARLLAILELGLGDGGAEVDVPQRRRLELVGAILAQQVEEGELRHALRGAADRRVGHRPVDRQARAAATAPRTPSRPRRSGARTAR